jgi:homoserine dehydrogenase
MTSDAAGGSRPGETTVRVGVLGCGHVGGALVEMLERDAEAIAARTGIRFEVAAVAVRMLSRHVGAGRDELFTEDAQSVATESSTDILVELIGGLEPARTLITGALKAGKAVVTANKELLANHGAELHRVAEEAGRDLLYEAAVAGAIPLLRALSVSLAGENIIRLMGIVNGTTNYILSEMSGARISYAAALAEAASRGYAEADPTSDVEGYDAAAKAAILAGLAFNAEVTASDVFREGIADVSLSDIEFAERLGYVVKLLVIAERHGEGPKESIGVRVHPAMLPVDHPLASVHGPFNAVFVEGEHSGELMFYGQGAGGAPTASAVLGDLIEAARNLGGPRRPAPPPPRAVAIRPIEELLTQYYVAIDVADRPGVLAAVATVFGSHDVSIRSMEQVGLKTEARIIFLTHMASEAAMRATLHDLAGLDAVERVSGFLRVIGPER